MVNLHALRGFRLRIGYKIVSLNRSSLPMLDPVGREALGTTKIIGREIFITIGSELSNLETSVTIYHEVLEAITVSIFHAPDSVQDFNEGDFESAGYHAHELFGEVSPENLNRMLQFYGFREN